MGAQPRRPTTRSRAPAQQSSASAAQASAPASQQVKPPREDEAEEEAHSHSSDSGSDDSDSDEQSGSGSESDSSSSSSESEAEGHDTGLDLDALAAEASQSLTEQKAARLAAARNEFVSEDMIGLAEPDLAAGQSASTASAAGLLPLPPVKETEEQIQALAAQYTATHPSLGETMAERSLRAHGGDRTRLDTALPKKTAKKVRAAERAKTAGKQWFGMPAVMPAGGVQAQTRSLAGPSATAIARSGDRSLLTKGGAAAVEGDARYQTAAEIRREMVAIRLRNAMDPKRFFRGHQKKLDIPPYAQIGTVIASAFAPKQQLGRGERGRSVVEEVMRDSTATEYARRKAAQMDARKPQGRTKYRLKGKKKKSSSQR